MAFGCKIQVDDVTGGLFTGAVLHRTERKAATEDGGRR